MTVYLPSPEGRLLKNCLANRKSQILQPLPWGISILLARRSILVTSKQNSNLKSLPLKMNIIRFVLHWKNLFVTYA